jgi:hypothetical protein
MAGCTAWALLAQAQQPQKPEVKTVYHIKYVAQGVVYLDGGRAAGLAEHMKLAVRREEEPSKDVAELEVLSVAETSSVCEIHGAAGEVKPGDAAYLSPEDVQTAQMLRAAGMRGYAQVVTFTDGDPLEEEAREYVPKPPLPEVNRFRGRIGIEYNSISDHSGLSSYQTGVVFRGDLTRIGGSYWNLSGYTRTRLTTQSGSGIGTQAQTLQDLLNRTYHLVLSYNNPDKPLTLGFGRFYLPWATSLDTIDGGYLGFRLGKHYTVGTFAGTTPDPTSWNYNPDRRMLGTFVSYEAGSFDGWRFLTTEGVAITRLGWTPERQFAFLETGLFYKRFLSVYHSMQVDKLPPALARGGSTIAPTRSFLTVRVQPKKYLSLDFSHNYFRDNPTFDARLIATGLVDKLLFQGVSAGFRLDLPYRFTVYSNVGRSDKSGDTRRTLNQMYGLTMNRLPWVDVRVDARYSLFDSSFGKGTYKTLSFSREFGEMLRLDLQYGQQNLASTFTQANRARFANAALDWTLGRHYFIGSGFTVYRSRTQDYDQIYFNLGYRF